MAMQYRFICDKCQTILEEPYEGCLEIMIKPIAQKDLRTKPPQQLIFCGNQCMKDYFNPTGIIIPGR